ncbi:MAG: DUF4830 domain-containing protein [Ruminiclostridium sp.]|nr:DUF4830 domain-containing protein [Ruminiclostridium sp.]
MFIITKKIPRRRLTAGLFLFFLTLGLLGAGLDLSRDIQAVSNPLPARPSPTDIRTNADRVAYLEGYGWITGEDPAAVEEILLPETFGEDYQEYLSLQSGQGFDLESYAGKTAKRYTYQIKNYPGLQENIWASILVYKKTVIGGEVFCNEGDGFTQSLLYPTAK